MLLGAFASFSVMAQNSRELAQRADVLLGQGNRQANQGDYAGSLTSLQSAYSIYRYLAPVVANGGQQDQMALQSRVSRTLAAMAYCYQGLGDSSRARAAAQQALTLGGKVNDQYAINLASQVLGALETRNPSTPVERYPGEFSLENPLGGIPILPGVVPSSSSRSSGGSSDGNKYRGENRQQCLDRVRKLIDERIARTGGPGINNVVQQQQCINLPD